MRNSQATLECSADVTLLLDALRCLPAGVIVIDDQGRIVFCNPMADAIRGVGERLGQPVASCHPPRAIPALEKLLERFRDAPPDRNHPLVVERGGKWEVLYQRITAEDGAFRGIVWLAHEISRQKALQQQLLQHERMASLGNMAARLAHDIRNPLNVVAGAAHNLRALVEDPVAQEMVELIESQVRRLEKLLQQLRELTRPLRPRFAQVDPVKLVSTYLAEQPPNTRRRISFLYPPGEFFARLDPDLVRRFLDNGVNNALRVSPQVEVELALSTQPEGEWLEIRLKDWGPGFPQEVLGRLFQPFVSTRPDGLGLGLVIMREICALHEGEMTVSNLPEGGALVVGRFSTR
ncbi:MAG: sensor histidine kinase [Thermoanaerobaculaceae bacterium]